jgi:excisionase family DNA binding protein
VQPQLLSVHQFSESTGISTSTIYRKTQTGGIPSVNVAGQVRIPTWYLDELTRHPGQLPTWLKKGEVNEL